MDTARHTIGQSVHYLPFKQRARALSAPKTSFKDQVYGSDTSQGYFGRLKFKYSKKYSYLCLTITSVESVARHSIFDITLYRSCHFAVDYESHY